MKNNQKLCSTIKDNLVQGIRYAENKINENDWPKAIQCLDNIIKNFGENAPINVYALLSICYRLQKKYEDALNIIYKGIDLHGNNAALMLEYKKIMKNNEKTSSFTQYLSSKNTDCNEMLHKKITISLSYYNDSQHLQRHFDRWSTYNDLIRFQIIDDGSRVAIDKIIEDCQIMKLDLRVFRIEEDIPWNIPGVRNLGATVCATPWILICDMDQTFERPAIQKMLKLIENGSGSFYSFARNENTSTRGTMLISLDDYWKVGGYDEDLTGNYGYNDPLFRKQLEKQNIIEIVTDDVYCIQHSADCALNRDTKQINADKMKQKISELPRSNWNTLRFKWSQLSVNSVDSLLDVQTKKITLPKIHCHEELMRDLKYKSFISDEIIMRWFNEQYSTSKHLLTLYSIVKGLNAKTIIEIGFGRSTFVLARAVHENGGTLITCDANNFSYLLNDEERKVVKFIHGDASKVWDICETGIDFAFLDFFSITSLNENYSFRHITNCVEKMKQNAVLAVHDSMDDRYNLKKVLHSIREEFEKKGVFIELVNLPFNYGLCLIRRISPSSFGYINDEHKKKVQVDSECINSISRVRNYTNYKDYIVHQKKKTLDPVRRAKWLNEEWTPKVEYFKNEFKQYLKILPKNAASIGLAARTGQEIFAMKELGLDAIGIDIVPNPPLVILGDLHNIPFPDSVFDFAFSNAIDHSLYPDKFMSEARRILKTDGIFLLHISLNEDSDEYGEIVIRDPNAITKLFGNCKVIKSEHMNPWGGMNYRILLKKI